MHERRALLKFIAASPLSLFPDLAHAVQTGGLEPAAHALDVFDFEAAAQKVVPPRTGAA